MAQVFKYGQSLVGRKMYSAEFSEGPPVLKREFVKNLLPSFFSLRGPKDPYRNIRN